MWHTSGRYTILSLDRRCIPCRMLAFMVCWYMPQRVCMGSPKPAKSNLPSTCFVGHVQVGDMAARVLGYVQQGYIVRARTDIDTTVWTHSGVWTKLCHDGCSAGLT